ncbi:MAG: hypothetical protein R5N60_09705, partial [Cutibacterium granulosum]|nr:hypothetical protein [Cutibacterium granulosum]
MVISVCDHELAALVQPFHPLTIHPHGSFHVGLVEGVSEGYDGSIAQGLKWFLGFSEVSGLHSEQDEL